MLRLVAVAVAALIPFIGLNGIGQAQTVAEITGDVQAVDCNAGTITLDANGNPDNADTIYASDSTAVTVESSSVPFCTLDGYIGAPVTAWVVPYGSQLYATQIDVTGPAYVAPAPQASIAPLPIIGTVLGTVLLGGLLYLVANSASSYYLYPYYGAYYYHYHRTWYRPYAGYYPASAPIISVAEPIYGSVLGVVTVNHYEYLAVRDRDGQFRRYPYYGPYHSYYSQQYHVTPRAYSGGYAGTVVRAPVAQGDAHWDAPRYTMQQISRTVTSRPTPWSAPHRVGVPGPATQPRPAFQRTQQQPQAQPTYQRPQFQQQPQPTYTRPQPQYQRPQPQQPQPTYQRPQVQQQPQTQPAYTRPQPQYQRPQPQQPQPTYQRPQVQQQPQTQPTYTRPQPQYQQPQPTYQRPQVQQQPQTQPAYTRPQPQYQRPQSQQPQPTYQRPQVQQQQAPARQDNGRGNGGGGRGQQQCDPRSNQQCNNGNHP